MKQLARAKPITRRSFLKASAATTGGLVIGFNLPAGNRLANAQPAPAAVPAATIAPSAEPAKAEPVTAPPKSAAVSAPVLALQSTLTSPAKAESPAPPAPLSPKLAARMDAGALAQTRDHYGFARLRTVDVGRSH